MAKISKMTLFDDWLELATGLFAPDTDSEHNSLAIMLPVDAAQAEDIYKAGKGNKKRTRTPREEMHVTLAFLGDTEDLSDFQVAAVLFATQNFARFTRGLSGLIEGSGTFPERPATEDTDGNEKVTFAIPSIPGLNEFRTDLIRELMFAGALDSRLRQPDRELGSEHGFVPHITVGMGDGFEFNLTEAIPVQFNEIVVAVGGRQQVIPLARGERIHDFTEVTVPEDVLEAYRRRSETIDITQWPAGPLARIIKTGEITPAWADLTRWVWSTEESFDTDEWGGYNWLEPVGKVLYTDLSTADLTPGKPIEGMAFPPDALTDMHGRVITFDDKDSAAYVANTTELINATQDSEGVVVGLPIDAGTHDMGDGAGWIVGVEPSTTTTPSGEEMSIILFAVKWTELGVEKITKGIRRFFSPTIDIVGKVILGGALTNWPATKDSQNRPLLKPVELSGSISYGVIHEDTMPNENDVQHGDGNESGVETDAIRTMIQEEMRPVLAAFTSALNPGQESAGESNDSPGDGGGVDLTALLGMFDMGDAQQQIAEAIREQMLGQYAQIKDAALVEAAAQIAYVRREADIVDFCRSVTSGSEEQPRGLPVDADSLKTLLLELSQDHATRVMTILDSVVQDGLLDFGAEYGHNRRDTGGTETLPDAVLAGLKSGDLTLDDLNNPIISEGLGDLAQYDLSQFENGGG